MLACYNMMIPYLCPELPDRQSAALKSLVKVPLVYSNVALTNWRSLKRAGAGMVFTPNAFHQYFMIDFPVSMGGYNTTMNILATGVPALVWPFPQNREQRLRAGRLADMGALRVLEDEDLHPDRLAVIMDQWISRSTRPTVNINLNGAANTAKWVENQIKAQPLRHEGRRWLKKRPI